MQVCAKIKLRCDLLGARDLCLLLSCFFCCDSFSWSSTASVVIYPNQVALRFVWKALGAVWACNEWLIHPVKITVPGCSSACPEGTGRCGVLQRVDTHSETFRSVPGCSSARLEGTGTKSRCILCSLSKGHQTSTRMLFSLTGRHWSVTNLVNTLLLLRRSRQDGEIKSCLAQKRASCESKSKTCGAQRTHH